MPTRTLRNGSLNQLWFETFRRCFEGSASPVQVRGLWKFAASKDRAVELHLRLRPLFQEGALRRFGKTRGPSRERSIDDWTIARYGGIPLHSRFAYVVASRAASTMGKACAGIAMSIARIRPPAKPADGQNPASAGVMPPAFATTGMDQAYPASDLARIRCSLSGMHSVLPE